MLLLLMFLMLILRTPTSTGFAGSLLIVACHHGFSTSGSGCGHLGVFYVAPVEILEVGKGVEGPSLHLIRRAEF